MTQLHRPTEQTARNLLISIGIGQFNATQVIPFLFTQPATTDPKQPAVMMLVKHLQRELNKCGANIAETGFLDLQTAHALTSVVGERWETMTWADNVQAVASAVANHVVIADTSGVGVGLAGLEGPRPLSPPATFRRRMVGKVSRPAGAGTVLSELGLFGLPDVPGGVVTYGVAAFLLYRYLKKKKG